MSASEYICKNCREVQKAGMITGGKRYQCPDCGLLCPDCVDTGIFSNKCGSCSKKVMKYEWNRKQKKWLNA